MLVEHILFFPQHTDNHTVTNRVKQIHAKPKILRSIGECDIDFSQELYMDHYLIKKQFFFYGILNH